MTEQERNVETLRDAYIHWQNTKGDAQVWLDILDDHVDWGSLADGAPGMEFTQKRASKDDVVGYFAGLAENWTMNSYHINEFVAQGGRVVAIGECSWTHKRTGKTAAIGKVDVWMFENGKVTQFMEFFDTLRAVEATLD